MSTDASFLRQFAGEHQLDFLDASEWLGVEGKRKTFIPGDLHLNDLGHRVVARELRDSLAPILGVP